MLQEASLLNGQDFKTRRVMGWPKHLFGMIHADQHANKFAYYLTMMVVKAL